jgi:hypothetical protein
MKNLEIMGNLLFDFSMPLKRIFVFIEQLSMKLPSRKREVQRLHCCLKL